MLGLHDVVGGAAHVAFKFAQKQSAWAGAYLAEGEFTSARRAHSTSCSRVRVASYVDGEHM